MRAILLLLIVACSSHVSISLRRGGQKSESLRNWKDVESISVSGEGSAMEVGNRSTNRVVVDTATLHVEANEAVATVGEDATGKTADGGDTVAKSTIAGNASVAQIAEDVVEKEVASTLTQAVANIGEEAAGKIAEGGETIATSAIAGTASLAQIADDVVEKEVASTLTQAVANVGEEAAGKTAEGGERKSTVAGSASLAQIADDVVEQKVAAILARAAEQKGRDLDLLLEATGKTIQELQMTTAAANPTSDQKETAKRVQLVIVLGLARHATDNANFISYEDIPKKMNEAAGDEYAYTIQNFRTNRSQFMERSRCKLAQDAFAVSHMIHVCILSADLLLFNCNGIVPERFCTTAQGDAKQGFWTCLELTELGHPHNKNRVVWTWMDKNSAVPDTVPFSFASLKEKVPSFQAYCHPAIEQAVKAYYNQGTAV